MMTLRHSLMNLHRCPVCRREVKPVGRGLIPLHFDSLGFETCPAGLEPFYITVAADPELILRSIA